MKKVKTKKIKKERIKNKIRIIEKEPEYEGGAIYAEYFRGFWKGKEVMHGQYESFYTGYNDLGAPKVICKYRYGKYHGRYDAWFEGGYKAYEGFYRNGKQNGRWKTWYDDGGIESIIHYKDGKKDGRSIEYHREGGKELECIFKDNKMVKLIGEWEYEEMKDYVTPDEPML